MVVSFFFFFSSTFSIDKFAAAVASIAIANVNVIAINDHSKLCQKLSYKNLEGIFEEISTKSIRWYQKFLNIESKLFEHTKQILDLEILEHQIYRLKNLFLS
uniref:PABS domain-containing protein n=1 Tax=Romanomermis culicivorax TaxID=13658 RepID=A0A915IC29_ROMCU